MLKHRSAMFLFSFRRLRIKTHKVADAKKNNTFFIQILTEYKNTMGSGVVNSWHATLFV